MIEDGQGAAATDNYRSVDRRDPRYRPHPSGGRPAEFARRYEAQASSGQMWSVTRDCASSCTMGFGAFSKEKTCIARNARVGFHEGNTPRSTAQLWASYPPEIRSLISQRGGLRLEWLWIPASEFHRMGYKVC